MTLHNKTNGFHFRYQNGRSDFALIKINGKSINNQWIIKKKIVEHFFHNSGMTKVIRHIDFQKDPSIQGSDSRMSLFKDLIQEYVIPELNP